jgi:hypothetical protein
LTSSFLSKADRLSDAVSSGDGWDFMLANGLAPCL